LNKRILPTIYRRLKNFWLLFAICSSVIFMSFNLGLKQVEAAGNEIQEILSSASLDAELAINLQDFPFPLLTNTLVVSLPDTWQEVNALKDLETSDPLYYVTIMELLEKLGIEAQDEIYRPETYIEFFPYGSPGYTQISLTQTTSILTEHQTIDLIGPYHAVVEKGDLTINIHPLRNQVVGPQTITVRSYGVDPDLLRLRNSSLSIPPVISDSPLQAAYAWRYPSETKWQEDYLIVPLPEANNGYFTLGDFDLALPSPATLTTIIVFDTENRNYSFPTITTTVEILVPTGWPKLQELRSLNPTERDYSPTLDAFINTIIYRKNRNIYPRNFHASQPKITIDEGYARVVFSRSERNPFNFDRYEIMPEFPGVYLIIDSEYVLHDWVAKEVHLNSNGLEIYSASPLPSFEDLAGQLVWTFPAGAAPSIISTYIELPRNLILSGFWMGKYPGVSILINLLNIFFSLIVVLGVIRILPKSHPSSESWAVINRTRKLLYRLVQFLLGAMLVYYLSTIIHPGITLSYPRVGSINLPPLSVMLALGSILVYSANQYQGFPDYRRPISLAVILVATGLVITFSISGGWFPFQYPVVTIVWVFFQLFLLQALIVLTFVIIYYLLLAFLPSEVAINIVEKVQQYKRVVFSFLVIFSILVTLQWLNYDLSVQNLLPVDLTLQLFFEEIRGVYYGEGKAYDILHQINNTIGLFPVNLLFQLVRMLPLIALVGIGGLLYLFSKRENSAIISPDQSWIKNLVCLLFAGFVASGHFVLLGVGFPIGFFLTYLFLSRLISTKLASAQEWIEMNNPGLMSNPAPVVMSSREEFIQRAKSIEDLEIRLGELYSSYSKGEMARVAYEAQRGRLSEELNWLSKGGSHPPSINEESVADSKRPVAWPLRLIASWIGVRRKAQPNGPAPSLVRLPDHLSPKDLALSLGPGENWWSNGWSAIKVGRWLALLPISYYLYVLITYRVKTLFNSGNAIFSLFNGLFSELAFWLTAALVLGILYPYLWGKTGVLKGAFLAGVYAAVVLIIALINMIFNANAYTEGFFRLLQLFLFLVALGFLLDLQTLRKNNFYWKQIFDHYNLQDVRTLVGYLSPLTLAILGLAQQLLSGAATQSIITDVIRGLNTLLPNL
jgi:hypothetical protein